MKETKLEEFLFYLKKNHHNLYTLTNHIPHFILTNARTV